jgi:hypothetical protein
MMLAPCACRLRQIAAPTRLAPPVIKTTLPCTLFLRYILLVLKAGILQQFPDN